MNRSLICVVTSALALAAPLAAQTVLNTQLGFGMDDGAITPDGRFGVVRENTQLTSVRIYDMATGQLRATAACSQGTFSTAAQDAVAVSNTRAIVLGSCALVLDLTNLAAPLLAEHMIGFAAQDVEITPDGTLGVIRGGSTVSGSPGGLFVIDMATGAMLATHPGEPSDPFTSAYAYDVDSVAVTNDHAVCLSIVDPNTDPHTRVTIWDLHPSVGTLPQVVFETTVGGQGVVDQAGAPHDLAITPDGQYVAVRSEFTVGLYSLNGSASTRVWHHRLYAHPGPFGASAMDSIEVTNDRVVTTSRYSVTTFGAQIDVFDIAGNRWSDRMRGDPHDLTITPNGTRALVRTHLGVFLYDIANLPAGPDLAPLARDETLVSTHTFYGAGYDSIQTTDQQAIAVARVNTSATINFYDISNDQLDLAVQFTLPEKPVDVAISPDHLWASVTGTSYVQVFDFATRTLALAFDPAFDPVGYFPWCDGVEVNDDSVLAWGYNDTQNGWVSVIDLFSQPSNYCTAAVNSTGVGSTLHATGSASIARNDFHVWADDVPSGAQGFFVYGSNQTSVPFGAGYLCVSGLRHKMPLVHESNGIAGQPVDYNGTVAVGGAITAGSSWNFQLRYRDPGTGNFNFSDGLAVTFTN
jgi:hypothetical protein